MTLTATIITALIAGGIAFLLGWVVCKAVSAQQAQSANSEPAFSDGKESVIAGPVPHDIAELQTHIQRLQHDKAELNAKNSRYEDRINEQVRMLANLQEDRDRIRVEHGSQKRLIHTLQQTGLNKDEARQSIVKQQQAYEEQISSLEKQLAALEKTAGKAPVPSMMAEADGISLREQLTASKAKEASLTSQLQALQEWAKPLAAENTQQRELIERLKHQVGVLRNEQQQTEAKLVKLSAAIEKARAVKQERAAAEATTKHLALTEAATASDHVTAPIHSQDQKIDHLEETHTDLQNAKDDLKKIYGIGPGLEKRLNGAGIFNYAQLAELGEDQLKSIASRTKKAQRMNWVNEARQLMGQAAAN